MERYIISIQNPRYTLEVFVWDRKAMKVVFSTGYPELSIGAQASAIQRCQKFIDTLSEGSNHA